MLAKFALVAFLAFLSIGEPAKILGIVPSTSYSHQVAFHQLWRELSLRGDKVTTLTTDPINDPKLTNLTEIDLHFSYDAWTKQIPETVNKSQTNLIGAFHAMMTTMHDVTEKQLEHPQVTELIRNRNITFDLVMAEYFMPSMFAFATRFDCPLVGILSMNELSNNLKVMGNPTHPVLYPDVLLSFSKSVTLYERTISVLFYWVLEFYYNHYFFWMQQKHVETFFDPSYPSIKDVAQNVSLLLVNTNPIFGPVKALLPNVIQFGGGTHRKPAKPLPSTLQTVLDAATQGVVYFSLGSNVKSEDLSVKTRNVILETFAELPYVVLWKFESEHFPNLPPNVVISKWLPQQDVLKHPNVKLFITQGGVQSTEEAIYEHVPMVGLPFFGDQFYNVMSLVNRGCALSLDYTQLEKEEFKATIMKVIQNPKFKNRIAELSALALDQPMTGLERAIWWTEYVIRHKGAKHLRSPFLDIPFYQYYFLDLISIILLAIAVVYTVFKFTFKVVNRICSKKSKLKNA